MSLYCQTNATSGSTNTTWRQWATSSNTYAITTSADPWITWCANDSTTATSTWTTWAGSTTTGTYFYKNPYAITPQPVQTPEQIAARQAEEQAHIGRMAEARLKREAAKAKAEATLVEHLSAEQEQAWKENRAIFVRSQSGRKFRIAEGHGGNLTELGQDDKPIRGFCVHVDHEIPAADNMLTQKLALQHDEAALLRVANSWEMRNGRRVEHEWRGWCGWVRMGGVR